MADAFDEGKMEAALKAVMEDAGSGIANDRILLGQQLADTKLINCVVCHCLGATEDPQVPGNWTVRSRVGVFGNPDAEEEADTPLDDFNAEARAINNQLNKSDLGALLSAEVSDFYVYDPPIARRKVADTEGRKWVRWTELDQYVNCLDI